MIDGKMEMEKLIELYSNYIHIHHQTHYVIEVNFHCYCNDLLFDPSSTHLTLSFFFSHFSSMRNAKNNGMIKNIMYFATK